MKIRTSPIFKSQHKDNHYRNNNLPCDEQNAFRLFLLAVCIHCLLGSYYFFIEEISTVHQKLEDVSIACQGLSGGCDRAIIRHNIYALLNVVIGQSKIRQRYV